MLIRTLVGCYYNRTTTVCVYRPTHTFSSVHTHSHPYTRSRMHIFSSVGLHFLIRTHTCARSRTRGALGQDPSITLYKRNRSKVVRCVNFQASLSQNRSKDCRCVNLQASLGRNISKEGRCVN